MKVRLFSPDGDSGCWLLFFTAAPLLDISGKTHWCNRNFAGCDSAALTEDALRQHQAQLETLVAERTAQLEIESITEDDRKELEMLFKIEEAQQQLLQSEKMSAIGQLAAWPMKLITRLVLLINLGSLKTHVNSPL